MMTEFMDLINQRQSDRKYIDKPIEKEKLMRCLEAARLAPSASNSQPWTFVVVDQPELRQKVGRAAMGPLFSFNKFATQAPVIVAIVMEKPKLITEMGGRIKKKEYPLIDAGITAEHFCLQAAEEGFGSCMLGWFDEKQVKELIKVPEEKSIPLLITVGYTPENYKHRKKIRRSFQQVVKFNTYG
jgi:nitroreductase